MTRAASCPHLLLHLQSHSKYLVSPLLVSGFSIFMVGGKLYDAMVHDPHRKMQYEVEFEVGPSLGSNKSEIGRVHGLARVVDHTQMHAHTHAHRHTHSYVGRPMGT
jgi:hypothetical protein